MRMHRMQIAKFLTASFRFASGNPEKFGILLIVLNTVADVVVP